MDCYCVTLAQRWVIFFMGEKIKKALEHQTKTSTEQLDCKKINYKSTRGQRSAFLLEDKFGLKQEKE